MQGLKRRGATASVMDRMVSVQECFDMMKHPEMLAQVAGNADSPQRSP